MKRSAHQNRIKKSQSGVRYAALAILFLILLAIAGYFLYRHQTRSASPVPPESTASPTPPSGSRTPPAAVATPSPAPERYQQAEPGVPATLPQQPEPQPDAKPRTPGTLAIVIDDMGTSLQEARQLADIGVPLTFSIIPGLRQFREVASYAVSRSIETMIHIPMQPREWPQRRLEANGLLLSLNEQEIAERIAQYVRDIPSAIGANNHMGSAFSEHEDAMRATLKALKSHGMFYIDSVTTPQTVGQKMAREVGVKSGKRMVFLDNEQNERYIRGQLDQAVRLALKNGGVIAICHPHPATISTLAVALPELAAKGVTLVPASQLVR